jgi:hypothetical protein
MSGVSKLRLTGNFEGSAGGNIVLGGVHLGTTRGAARQSVFRGHPRQRHSHGQGVSELLEVLSEGLPDGSQSL